jgi:exodeoxyribonuclease VII large subunit
VHAAAAIGPSAHLTIEFADGRVGATADADRPQATPPAAAAPHEAKPAAPRRVAKPVDQGSLF